MIDKDILLSTPKGFKFLEKRTDFIKVEYRYLGINVELIFYLFWLPMWISPAIIVIASWVLGDPIDVLTLYKSAGYSKSSLVTADDDTIDLIAIPVFFTLWLTGIILPIYKLLRIFFGKVFFVFEDKSISIYYHLLGRCKTDRFYFNEIKEFRHGRSGTNNTGNWSVHVEIEKSIKIFYIFKSIVCYSKIIFYHSDQKKTLWINKLLCNWLDRELEFKKFIKY